MPSTSVSKKFGKKGSKVKRSTARTPRAARLYPADDAPKNKLTRAKVTAKSIVYTRKPTRLRASITPGTVLIILSGHFRAKRVVFLKQLSSGLLLVTGPLKINGVPLRRVNQAYVIATTTRVDISGIDVPAHINDAYFKREKKIDFKPVDGVFTVKPPVVKTKLSPEKKADQKAIDNAIRAEIRKTPFLKHYLTNAFTLGANGLPHEIKF
ncbi:MAG: 60S ribosomal protein L6 [archaeon]|nr:60S ribosomal protein L6 [archaeon]